MTSEKAKRLSQLTNQLAENLMTAAICAEEIRAAIHAEGDGDHAVRQGYTADGRFLNPASFPHRPLVDTSSLLVLWAGKTCHLGYTISFRLAERLFRRPNHYITMDQLLRDVWEGGLRSPDTRRCLRVPSSIDGGDAEAAQDVLYVEGHLQPYGLYRNLWEHRNHPVVLDDLDKLYADADCVRLLKPLCNSESTRRVSWLTNLTMNALDVPSSFTTTSSVILIANEWRTVNPNVRALEDRAIILHFDPSNTEVHRRVGEWFDDREVYEFIDRTMPFINALSMRHYYKGSQLRRAGLSDWRDSLLQMVLSNARLARFVAAQQAALRTEQARVDRFMKETGCSRATYFRIKARMEIPR